ncbi:hypothetical protein I549_2636 [Mycobacterium avium subsp. avium 2285 (R)]|nr:hypothetical protein I549_2636 [Mycobacterium avium subsp. avium 2285 (R)]
MHDVQNAPGEQIRDLAWYAAAVDTAASSDSRYAMSTALRSQFGYHIYEELPEDAPTLAKATCWAFDYATEIGKNNAKLMPRHLLGDQTDPRTSKRLTSRSKRRGVTCSRWYKHLRLNRPGNPGGS